MYCPACHSAVPTGSAVCPSCALVSHRFFVSAPPADRRLPVEGRRRWLAGLLKLPLDSRGVVLDAPLGQEAMLRLERFESESPLATSKMASALIWDILALTWKVRSAGGGCLVCGNPSIFPHTSNPEVCFGQHSPMLRVMGLRRRRGAVT